MLFRSPHDRYLLERVTDQQYALLGGHLRHVPGGVDEYLRLLERAQAAPPARPATSGTDDRARPAAASDQRAARKELGAVERRLAKVTDQVSAVEKAMVEHDPTNHVGLIALSGRLDALNAEVAELEDRWMALADAADPT